MPAVTSGYKFLAILQFAISTSKPPAPVALQGRLCQSAKPHEYKRSLVWLNLPYPTNWEEPKVRRPPLSISILQRRQGTPPSNLPPPIKFPVRLLFHELLGLQLRRLLRWSSIGAREGHCLLCSLLLWVGLRARDFPTGECSPGPPLIIRTVDQRKVAIDRWERAMVGCWVALLFFSFPL